MYNSVIFSIFTKLCNHHHYVILEHFHHPKEKPCTHLQWFPFFLSPSPWQLLLYFLLLWICLFWTFYINEIMQNVAFCIWLLSLSVMFSKFHPCCNMYQYSIPVFGQITFHCINVIYFVYHFICWWMSWFQFLAIFSNAAIHIYVHVFLQLHVFNSPDTYLGVELLGHMVALCLTFWGTAKLFSTAAEPFYILNSSMQKVQFLHLLANNCYFPFFIIAILVSVKWCFIVALIFISLMTNDVEHLFMCLLAIYIFFGDISTQILYPF